MSEIMKRNFWTVFLVLFWLIQQIIPDDSLAEDDGLKLDHHPPLTKSLGFAIRRDYGSTLENAKMNKEFIDHYNDMLKVSEEALEAYAKNGDRRLRRVVGEHNYEMMKEGVLDRRRNSRLLESAAGLRRVKTQALRRQKLNSQGLRSHQHHTQQSAHDSATDS